MEDHEFICERSWNVSSYASVTRHLLWIVVSYDVVRFASVLRTKVLVKAGSFMYGFKSFQQISAARNDNHPKYFMLLKN